MRMEGISTSISEINTKLTPDATKLLVDDDYISFFMTCGPKFVSAIHRAQEVTAIFAFDAEDRLTAQQFSAALHKYIHGFSGKNGEKEFKIPMHAGVERNGIRDVLKSLSIEIMGYGLALNAVGTETLVATSLEEFNRVMKFALNSMGRETEDHKQIGMIDGITVMPWMSFPHFHSAAEIDYADILVRVPRTSLDSAQIGKDDELYCLNADLIMDGYGRCCESNELITVNDFGATLIKPKCVSTNFVMPAEINKNMDTNAEFVSQLSKMVRDKVEGLSTLGQCVNTLRSFSKRFDYFFLQSVGANYNKDIEMQITVKELRSALDPTGDLSILSIIGKEQDEYFEMFYKPCLSSLYGLHKGIDGSLDPKYFMANVWSNFEECARPNCLHRGMVWDRKNGGKCVEGILARKKALAPVPSEKDPYCAIAVNMTSGKEECKHIPNSKVIKQIDVCRKNLISSERSAYSMTDLIDYFCMPRLAVHEKADLMKMDDVDHKATICSTGNAYPKCNVTHIHNVGDGFCDGYEFNTEECGWDGGDCDAFNSNTPNCTVPYPYLVGNGYCDGYDYDTLECNYDGGDCDEFNALYPDCNVKYPYLIGNGFCDGDDYNVEECGWDGGDCELVNTEL